MNKYCTDISQWELLNGILPLETADLHYSYCDGDIESEPHNGFSPVTYINYINTFLHYVPSWSLTALTNLIPNPTFYKDSEGKEWVCSCDQGEFRDSDQIDLCVKVILELHKTGKLKIEGYEED